MELIFANKQLAILIGIGICLYIFKVSFEIYTSIQGFKYKERVNDPLNGFKAPSSSENRMCNRVTKIEAKTDKIFTHFDYANKKNLPDAIIDLVDIMEKQVVLTEKHINNQDKIYEEIKRSNDMREERYKLENT